MKKDSRIHIESLTSEAMEEDKKKYREIIKKIMKKQAIKMEKNNMKTKINFDMTNVNNKQVERKVKKFMLQNIEDHIDKYTGEVNLTSLAEEAGDEFKIYEDKKKYKIEEVVYDWAVEVEEEWSRKNKKSSINLSQELEKIAEQLSIKTSIDEKSAMTKIKEMSKDAIKHVEKEALRLFKSGAINPDDYEDNYLLPKLIMVVALRNTANQYDNPTYKKEIKNLSKF